MNAAEQNFAKTVVDFLGLGDQHISQLQLNIDAQAGINVVARIFPKGFVANDENAKANLLAYKVTLEELSLEQPAESTEVKTEG